MRNKEQTRRPRFSLGTEATGSLVIKYVYGYYAAMRNMNNVVLGTVLFAGVGAGIGSVVELGLVGVAQSERTTIQDCEQLYPLGNIVSTSLAQCFKDGPGDDIEVGWLSAAARPKAGDAAVTVSMADEKLNAHFGDAIALVGAVVGAGIALYKSRDDLNNSPTSIRVIARQQPAPQIQTPQPVTSPLSMVKPAEPSPRVTD